MSGLLALPKVPSVKAEGRVHRLDDDKEGEAIMPKGHYERKPKGTTPEPANDPAPTRKKRAYRKKAELVAVKPKTNGAHAVAAFGASLDLRSGAVTINAASGSLSLAPDEVMALLGFLRR